MLRSHSLQALPVAGLALVGLLLPVLPAAASDPGVGRSLPITGERVTPAFSAEDEAEARYAYERALADLGRGRGAEGQRRLEWLIVRYPDSPHADAARAKLAGIYQAVAQAPSPSGLGVSPSGRREPASGGWSVDVARISPLVEAFREQAGDRVFFASGSAELGSRARGVLKRQAEWLLAHPGATLRLEGHADDPGSAVDNQRLAERRADAVRRALIEEGVAAQRIGIDGHGREARIALCRDAVCSAQNRRVVSVVEANQTAAVVGWQRRGPGRD